MACCQLPISLHYPEVASGKRGPGKMKGPISTGPWLIRGARVYGSVGAYGWVPWAAARVAPDLHLAVLTCREDRVLSALQPGPEL